MRAALRRACGNVSARGCAAPRGCGERRGANWFRLFRGEVRPYRYFGAPNRRIRGAYSDECEE